MTARRRSIYAFAALLLAIVAILIVPLPPWLLDILLGINVFGSALVLLLSVTVDDPLEFSTFAPALLVATIFRLSLDVSATRLILTAGTTPGAVGAIIPAFGAFVVHGNLVVGLIVFAILVTIQFVVIASGSQRVAEVAARFTLDAMPGKQMAIDADLNAGLINENQARARRDQVAKEAEFYGAMDGAARFNQRDAMATVLITGINIIAGFLIGVFQLDIPLREALRTYTTLTVGDGLVTMIPSFLVSIAGGMVVTRAGSDNSLGVDLGRQLFSTSRPLWIASGVLLALALIPGLPKIPFFKAIGNAPFLLARVGWRVLETAKPLGAPRPTAS